MLTVCLAAVSSIHAAEPTPAGPNSGAGGKKPEVKPASSPGEAPDAKAKPEAKLRQAVIAGGCFWCVEAVFEELDGVTEVESGYAGGSAETANYKAVCTGETGHAEAVRITYDPAKVDYRTLLEVHFATHDPTTLNRQGNDAGPQYRSAIFFADEQERKIAADFIEELTKAKVFPKPIVTTLEPLKTFYPAERYHQNYVCHNPSQGYVQYVAMPKVEKVRKKFPKLLKARSPLEAGKSDAQPGGK